MRFANKAVVAALLFGVGSALVVFAAGGKGEGDKLRAGTEAWIKAFNAGDVDTMVALYAEDAVVMPPRAPAIKGHAALREFLQKEIAGAKASGITLILGPKNDAGVSGSMGWDSGDYTVRDKTGAVVDSGSYLAVWKKTGDKWQYLRDIWNSDRPPAAATVAK